VDRDTAHLELSIEVGSDPITGFVSNASYSSRPFSGWIELVGAIEAARSAGAGSGGSGKAGGQTMESAPGADASEL
jgi:hypothetical protein